MEVRKGRGTASYISGNLCFWDTGWWGRLIVMAQIIYGGYGGGTVAPLAADLR